MHPSDDIRGSRSDALAGRRIVLGVTGSIAAVETVRLCRELIRHGAEVIPVMSPEAARILHPNALEFASGRKPVLELGGAVEHVEFCGLRQGRADLLLIAPATANTISKMACGIDDTPVTTCATTAIGTGMKVLVAPAMHGSMYEHPILKRNIGILESMGVEFCWPALEENKAKLASVSGIAAAAANLINRNGRKMLVIAGPTAEPVDSMRTLSNRSSGLTGMAIASAAHMRGFRVELWHGWGLSPPDFIGGSGFDTTESLMALANGLSPGDHDVIVNCAAISDYRPAPFDGKIPSGKEGLSIQLETCPKVMPVLVERSGGAMVVGFKAETGLDTEDLARRGRELLEKYGLDLVAANLTDVAGMAETSVVLISADGQEDYRGPKEDFAGWLLDRISENLVTN